MPPDVSDLMVLVVADDPLARAGLAALLAAQPGCSVIGQVSTDSDLPAMLDVYQPDVLVWDLGWDPSQAIEALSDLTEGSPPIVALLPDETHVSDVRAAGARGILLRDSEARCWGPRWGPRWGPSPRGWLSWSRGWPRSNHRTETRPLQS